MTNIILIRHGQTDANRQYLIQGRIDNPLNSTGIDQARATAHYLKNHAIDFDCVYSSPLERAVTTAQTILDIINPDMDIITHDGLIERDFGDFEGHKIDDNYFQLVNNDLIPNMENHPVLEKRVFETLTEIANANLSKKILIVTHSHVIKAMLVHLVEGFKYSSFLPNCAINILRYDQNQFTVTQHNLDPLLENDHS